MILYLAISFVYINFDVAECKESFCGGLVVARISLSGRSREGMVEKNLGLALIDFCGQISILKILIQQWRTKFTETIN